MSDMSKRNHNSEHILDPNSDLSNGVQPSSNENGEDDYPGDEPLLTREEIEATSWFLSDLFPANLTPEEYQAESDRRDRAAEAHRKEFLAVCEQMRLEREANETPEDRASRLELERILQEEEEEMAREVERERQQKL